MTYEDYNLIDPVFDVYLHQIHRVKRLNRISTLLIGFSGIWWLWIYGLALFQINGDFRLILWAFLSSLVIIIIAFMAAEQSFTKKGLFVRGIGLFGILFLHFYDVNTQLSIIIYTFAIIFQDNLNPIIRRIYRTQKFLSRLSINVHEMEIIKLNTNYIMDRLNWILKTSYLILAAGFIGLIGIALITAITNRMNSLYIQYSTIIAFFILSIIFLPKMFPKIKTFDPYDIENIK